MGKVKVYGNDKKRNTLLADYDRLLKLWGVPFEEKDIVNKYGSTHVILTGQPSDRPLVLLHGVGDNSAVMWMCNIRALFAGYRCIAIDTIGGPGKSVPGEAYDKTFSQQAWIDSVLDALEVKSCYMMGVSNGAVMALAYSALRDRVEKLICVEGGPVTSASTGIKTLLKAFPEALWPTDNNIRKLMVKFAHPREGFAEENPDILRHMLLIMKAANQMAMLHQKPWLYDNKYTKKLRARTLFILGELSGAKNDDLLRLLSREGYAYRIIDNAGHGVNMEQVDQFNDIVLRFLSQP